MKMMQLSNANSEKCDSTYRILVDKSPNRKEADETAKLG